MGAVAHIVERHPAREGGGVDVADTGVAVRIEVGVAAVDARVDHGNTDALSVVTGQVDPSSSDVLYTPRAIELRVGGRHRVLEQPELVVELDVRDTWLPAHRVDHGERQLHRDRGHVAVTEANRGAKCLEPVSVGRSRLLSEVDDDLDVRLARASTLHGVRRTRHQAHDKSDRRANDQRRAKPPGAVHRR